jgi:serine/threonine protein phosphatase PrpC
MKHTKHILSLFAAGAILITISFFMHAQIKNIPFFHKLESRPFVDVTLNYGLAREKNNREYMEDYALTSLSKNKGSIFGVFDGHGGHQTSRYLQLHFARILRNNLVKTTIKKALHNTFERLDTEVRRITVSGSTASILFFDHQPTDALVATTGDSSIMWFNLDSNEPPQITRDHKISDKAERKRIEYYDGDITYDRDDPTLLRVNGSLAMSRSIGDHHVKELSPGAVIATPTIISVPLTSQNKYIFVIASDGFWDAVNINKDPKDKGPSDTRQVFTSKLRLWIGNAMDDPHNKKTINKKLDEIAQSLINWSKKSGSKDNITVQIVVATTEIPTLGSYRPHSASWTTKLANFIKNTRNNIERLGSPKRQTKVGNGQ